jgi:hypothetical protein
LGNANPNAGVFQIRLRQNTGILAWLLAAMPAAVRFAGWLVVEQQPPAVVHRSWSSMLAPKLKAIRKTQE